MKTMMNLKRTITEIILAAILASFGQSAFAQNYNPDPWGWGGRTTQQQQQAGRQATCRSYINEYNVVVEFYNNERDARRRRQWRDRLESIRRDSRPYNCGL